MKLIFYDFEVFSNDWMVVLINYETKEKTSIINNKDKLKEFYNLHKEDVWIGYNSRMYDQFILKGILLGMNPAKINDEIINENKNGYFIVKDADKFPLNNFDISTGFHSLKQLEGFMGSMIKETSIPFNINRKLNEKELNEVLKYCTHDVEQTIEVFKNKKEEFDSQLLLLQEFNLPLNMFNKTKAQLAAIILGAKRQESRNDEFNITIPDTLQISDKYKYVLDWYLNPDNRDYNKLLSTTIAGIPHVFAWGGIHGAINNYIDEGIILCCDVASLYPSIMIEYGFLSRNISEPNKFKEIRDRRLKLKKEKNPMQAPLKIVINATYGATKDKHNDLYDPLMANNVCVAGQLLLLDLIDKIEPYCKLLQSNTDGLFLKVNDMEAVNKIKKIAHEWEERTRLNLEWDIYDKIFQKDVNNYIISHKDGTYKSKGTYVKKLNNVDYDLPIVNKALVNYFINNKPIEETINECDNLRDFQKIVKVSNLYKYAIFDNKKLTEKVLRVFASTDKSASGVFKVKSADRIEKIANTPDNCFIYNDNVVNTKVTSYLDKQYYIDVANKRLEDFMSLKKSKSVKMPSGIKFVSIESKTEIEEILKEKYDTFIELLVYITDNTSINSREMEILIELNHFKDYGSNGKLLSIYKEFQEGKNKYKKSYCEKTKNKRIEALKEIEKNTENTKIPIKEQIEFEFSVLGYAQSTYNLPKSYVMILDLDDTYSPKVVCYCLNNGKTANMKIQKKIFNKNKIKQGDIINIGKSFSKPKSKYIDGKYEPIPDTKEWWIENYKKINL